MDTVRKGHQQGDRPCREALWSITTGNRQRRITAQPTVTSADSADAVAPRSVRLRGVAPLEATDQPGPQHGNTGARNTRLSRRISSYCSFPIYSVIIW